MNRPHLSSDASPRTSTRPSTHPSMRRSAHTGDHLGERLGERPGEADSRRRRRRTLQRCSAVVATLFLGTSQCDAPDTASSAAGQPAVTTTAAPVATVAPVAVPTPPADHTAGHPATTAAAATTTPTTAPARVVIPGPDGTEVAGRCTQYEDLLMIHAPAIGWDVLRMSRLAWRESNCWAEIRSRTSDSGLLQINDITLSFLNEALGEQVDAFTLMDPVQNVRAAAALCTFWARNGSSCYQPWSTS